MIDIIDEVKRLLVFDSTDDFYYLQIMKRKKDHPETCTSNNRIIKNYYIRSIEHLDSKYEEIKAICDHFNARATIRLNKRSFKQVAMKHLQNIANSIAIGDYTYIKNAYDRACGTGHNDENKKWIVDIDIDVNYPDVQTIITAMVSYISDCKPIGDKIITILPTKNGYHLITKPFDVMNFRLNYPFIDIHKDNPVNLYIP